MEATEEQQLTHDNIIISCGGQYQWSNCWRISSSKEGTLQGSHPGENKTCFSGHSPAVDGVRVAGEGGVQVGAQRASEGLRGRLYEALVAVLGYLYNGRVAPPPRDFLVEVLFASYTFEIPELVNLFQEAEESGGGGEGAAANADVYGRLARAGSRPPSCVHKCGGCTPCTATQVPATTDHSRTQYANYEPEGWKCKCGSAFYNP
ncbi:unnamed protein product [Musa acuminata subsp. malaccensis]|uniref:Epidermal patterning factor-like protein n=1 Tax=Musa acuminata subsp. malaccensis TaxID=214687 RepID=A0A804JVF2_MUSAM|nr:unnamed protein product [Musa acuminata subsp. malaccensis]